ncbi:A disintegrin and metalloproteinase with thrombospondin motifs adt-1-like [Clytia hemisphaerica]|uniref:Uncharacterized protein n=1 Tax=Clytia hemisphaerica TaxID=252671 RepID=A0A7M5VCY0_9CNID
MKLTIGIILFALYTVNAVDLKMCERQHGGLGNWMDWGPCKNKMGYECRHRYCDSPVPKYGGYPCSGETTQYRKIEKVDGGYGPWMKWGACKEVGYQCRFRFCDSPKPMYGGAPCEGDMMEKRMTPAVNGGFGKWMAWGPCSKTCGEGGVQTRHRFCNYPKPMYGGMDCDAKASMETRACPAMYMEACPPPGVLGTKGTYGKCSRGCGGQRQVTYPCNMPEVYSADAKCYMGCANTMQYEKCKCESDGRNVCRSCKSQTDRMIQKYRLNVTDVGLACKLENDLATKICGRLSGGIRDMYPSNDFYFLHCSDDGPWCKPCATRDLVYNPKCGQCEKTRTSPCTGPRKWVKKDAPSSNDQVADILNDADLW